MLIVYSQRGYVIFETLSRAANGAPSAKASLLGAALPKHNSCQSMHLPTISQNKACFGSYRLNMCLLGCGGKKHGVLDILTIDVIQPISVLKPNFTCSFLDM